MAERSTNPIEALMGLIQSRLLDMNTCIPGVIVSYDAGKATVRPTVQKRFEDGEFLDYPEIPVSRLCWPSFAGGAAGVRGPVRAGDPCLIVFSQQAVDGSDDLRTFDLQDAFAVMTNLGEAEQADSGNNNDMTMYFGAAYIRLTEAGELRINAPGGTNINTPHTVNTGKLTTQDLFTYQNGLSGKGGANGSSVSGDFTHSSGSLSSNGKVLHTHTHSGVQPGGGNSGGPT